MIGKTISHYKILEKLGGGGMGVVYKAQDLRLDRFVALKFLPPSFSLNEDAKSRFIHEAKAASSLDNNNICTIHEVDETEDGQLFICMNYYEGETLKKKIERGPLKINEAIEITLQIANGLKTAHEKGIIHRDIKPANIFITNDGNVKILDFGLAKLTGQTIITRMDSTLGTVAYMSPEQAQGEEVTHRTDIWSLGVVMYEMLTGLLPFKGDYEQAIIFSIINETPQSVTGMRTHIPLELERIITKCLEKDSSNRYQHTDDLIVDLLKLIKEVESKIEQSENVFRLAKSATSRKNLVRVTIGIFVISIILVAGYVVLNRMMNYDQPEDIKSIAILPFNDMSPSKDQEYFCDGMTEQITTNLSRLKNLRVRGRNSVMQFKNTSKTIPQIAKELNVGYLLEGSIRKVANRIRVTVQLIKADDDYHLWANDYNRELNDIFDVQDDIAKNVTEVLVTKLSAVDRGMIKTPKPLNAEAYEYLMKGKYYHKYKFWASNDIKDFTIAEKMLLTAVKLDSNYAPIYVELADLYNTYYWGMKDDNEKNKCLDIQENYLQRAYLLDSSSAEVNRVKGSIYYAKGEREKAYYYIKRSVELNKNDEANNIELCNFLVGRGLYDVSIKYALRVIELDPLVHFAYDRIVIAYWNMWQLDKAEIYCKKMLEIIPDDTYSLFVHARILFDMKKYKQFNDIRLKLEKMDADSIYLKYLSSLQYVLDGDKENALKTNLKPKPSPYANLFFMRFYDHFGMDQKFIQLLEEDFERLKEQEGSWYLWLKNGALFDNLRSYPRFKEILEKHKQLYEENLKKYND